MRLAVKLAKKATGFTSPNPLVGAVIVKNGRIIGQGWHHRAGMPHAEIEALRSLGRKSPAGADMYVTLEPCSTFGRTPPCCNAIIEAGIKRVFVGSIDPNPKHAGAGIERLKAAGIEVVTGVEKAACDDLNRAFFHWITTGKPYVQLKLAETLDGKIATRSGSSQWITGKAARMRAHELRLRADAVLVGAETARLDNPALTARDAKGNVLKTPRKLIAARHPANPDEICITDWNEFLKQLGAEHVMELLIEGGGELAESALRAGAVNRVEFHIAPKLLGGRGSRGSVAGPDPESISEAVMLGRMSVKRAGCDLIISADVLNANGEG